MFEVVSSFEYIHVPSLCWISLFSMACNLKRRNIIFIYVTKCTGTYFISCFGKKLNNLPKMITHSWNWKEEFYHGIPQTCSHYGRIAAYFIMDLWRKARWETHWRWPQGLNVNIPKALNARNIIHVSMYYYEFWQNWHQKAICERWIIITFVFQLHLKCSPISITKVATLFRSSKKKKLEVEMWTFPTLFSKPGHGRKNDNKYKNLAI